MSLGREQAAEMGRLVVRQYGLNLKGEPVAVSMMYRAQQTAIVAGFRKLHLYVELNEEKGDLTDAELRAALDTRQPPDATRAAARHLIEHPPRERVWVTHGLLIATLCQELEVYQDERFTPKFCEVRELPL